jgi:hypothetical protein
MDSQENQIGHTNPDQPNPKRMMNIQQGTQNDEVGCRLFSGSMTSTLDIPELFLRRYRDKVCSREAVVFLSCSYVAIAARFAPGKPWFS